MGVGQTFATWPRRSYQLLMRRLLRCEYYLWTTLPAVLLGYYRLPVGLLMLMVWLSQFQSLTLLLRCARLIQRLRRRLLAVMLQEFGGPLHYLFELLAANLKIERRKKDGCKRE